MDRSRLANRPRFHALPADAVRWLLFRFIGLIFWGGYLPHSDQLKFQQTSNSVLRDYFIIILWQINILTSCIKMCVVSMLSNCTPEETFIPKLLCHFGNFIS